MLPEAGVYRRLIFFGSGLSSVSPAVSLWWPGKVINLFNQFPTDALHYGTYATGTCVDFIVACSAVKKTKYQPMEVYNLPLRWEGQDHLIGDVPPRVLEPVAGLVVRGVRAAVLRLYRPSACERLVSGTSTIGHEAPK